MPESLLSDLNGRTVVYQRPYLIHFLIAHPNAAIGPVFPGMQPPDPAPAIGQSVNHNAASRGNALLPGPFLVCLVRIRNVNGSVTGTPIISPIQGILAFRRLLITFPAFVSQWIVAQSNPAAQKALAFTKESHFAFAFYHNYFVRLARNGPGRSRLT